MSTNHDVLHYGIFAMLLELIILSQLPWYNSYNLCLKRRWCVQNLFCVSIMFHTFTYRAYRMFTNLKWLPASYINSWCPCHSATCHQITVY